MIPARWWLRIYPRQWRARYGDELEELLDSVGRERGRLPVRYSLNLAWCAVGTHLTYLWRRARQRRSVLLLVGVTVVTLAIMVTVVSTPTLSGRSHLGGPSSLSQTESNQLAQLRQSAIMRAQEEQAVAARLYVAASAALRAQAAAAAAAETLQRQQQEAPVGIPVGQ